MIKIDDNHWVSRIDNLRLQERTIYPNIKWKTRMGITTGCEKGEPTTVYIVHCNQFAKEYKTKKEAMKHINMIQKQLIAKADPKLIT